MAQDRWDSIKTAVTMVANGVKRIDVDETVSVYSAGTIIRIDIKK